MTRTFTDKSIDAIKAKKSILCVGLDPQLQHMPAYMTREVVQQHGATFEAVAELFLRFNRLVIDAVADSAVWVKPQIAFYEAYGHEGIRAFEQTIQHAHAKGLLVITDAKRSDGMATAEAYAQAHLGKVPFWPDGYEQNTYEKSWDIKKLGRMASWLNTDAMTVMGYIGSACVRPFVDEAKAHGKGVFVVCKTSFKPNSEIEQTYVVPNLLQQEPRLWERQAEYIEILGKGTEGEEGWCNLGAVLGATYPEDTPRMREILPKSWLLVPGYGEQGGGADAAVTGADEEGFGITVNSSRGITAAYLKPKSPFFRPSEQFADSARLAAEAARDDLNAALRRAGKGKAFL